MQAPKLDTADVGRDLRLSSVEFRRFQHEAFTAIKSAILIGSRRSSGAGVP